MGTTTEVFNRLPTELSEVATVLLPNVQEADVPTTEEALRTRAYLVLCHSAIEEAVEHEIRTAVEQALIGAVALPHIAVTLSLAYSAEIVAQNRDRIPSTVASVRALPGLYYSKCIKTNNGIRRHSIEKMVRPLGVDLPALGDQAEVALGQLDTLGAKRGAVAHSLKLGTEESPHPVQASEWVNEAHSGFQYLIPRIVTQIDRTEEDVLDPSGEESDDT